MTPRLGVGGQFLGGVVVQFLQRDDIRRLRLHELEIVVLALRILGKPVPDVVAHQLQLAAWLGGRLTARQTATCQQSTRTHCGADGESSAVESILFVRGFHVISERLSGRRPTGNQFVAWRGRYRQRLLSQVGELCRARR